MKKNRILQAIIGLAIIALIFYKIDMSEVISVLKETNIVYFLMACLSYLGLNLILASRLGYLLGKIGYKNKFSSIFFSHMGGMIAGDITPGRSGYFLTPSILKKKNGTPITDGMACIFAPQGIEFILKVGGAFAAIIYISTFSGINRNILISSGIGATILLIVGISMLIVSWNNENLSLKLINKLPFFNKFKENISFFKERSNQVKGSINAILIFIAIGWFFAALHWFYIGKALGIELPFFAFFILHPLITILMFVPISPAGLGLMEGGIILVFSLLGILPAIALAFSVMVRVSILLVDLIGFKTVLTSFNDMEL